MVPCSATIIDPDQNGTRCFGEANDGSLARLHCWLTNRKTIPATIARAIRIPTTNASSGCRAGFRPFDPAPFCAAPMPSQKGRLLIASTQANPQGGRVRVPMASINSGHSPAHGSVLRSTSGQADWSPWTGRGSPWLLHAAGGSPIWDQQKRRRISPPLDDCPCLPNRRWQSEPAALPLCGLACARSHPGGAGSGRDCRRGS